MERSLIFTALLHLSPEFGRMTSVDGAAMITQIQEAWRADRSTDLYSFTKDWLETNPLA